MCTVSLFEAQESEGEKPLETKEMSLNMFNLGKYFINHGMSISWGIMLWLDEKTEVWNSMHTLTPCFIK